MELRNVSMEYLLIKGRHRDVFTNFEIFYRCKNEKWSFGKQGKINKKLNGHAFFNRTINSK